jgi:hypothetical protein
MEKLDPWKFGAVLSLAVLINYIPYTIFWYAFTGPSIDFMNGPFHGMDFRKIYAVTPFSIGTYLYVLLIFAVGSYLLGAIYAAVRNLLLAGDKAWWSRLCRAGAGPSSSPLAIAAMIGQRGALPCVSQS